MPFSGKRPESGGRLFDVECECGAEFRVPAEPEALRDRPASGLLVALSGECPWCGLRLEEIEPPTGRSGG